MTWTVMKHKGVNVSPVYDPKGYVVYKGNKVELTPLCEEYLVYWFRLKPIHRADPVVSQNFIRSLLKLKDSFRDSFRDLLTDKKVQAQFAKYSLRFSQIPRVSNVVNIDGVKYKVNNTVDMPGIFIGKGNHPMRGMIKTRIHPCDITINGTSNKKAANGERYKEFVELKESYYIASWKDPLFNKIKYIYATSDEESKFDECYRLKKTIHKIRRSIDADLTSPEKRIRQLACIVYMIDKLSFRVGHEKDADSSDSVGCCTILKRNVRPEGPRTEGPRTEGLKGPKGPRTEDTKESRTEFDFIGKSYIPYKKKVTLDPKVVAVLKESMENKTPDQEVFDVSAAAVNAYLDKLMPGLTAKMFRTFNASTMCSRLLKDKTTLMDLKTVFLKVATLCNHKRKKNNTYVVDSMTTKRNYIDPRIVYAYIGRNKITLSSVYNDSLQSCHQWASSVPLTFMY